MKRLILLLLRSDRAASAAEFAMVLPLLLLLMFGIIDIGRFMWTINQAEKATQMGVRYAVVSDPAANVINTDFVNFGIAGGDAVPTATFDSAVCTDSGNCTVSGTGGIDTSRNAAAFTNIVTWMQKFYPAIQASNVQVTYQNVGLGYSGDPNGPDVAALTTVELHDLPFQPMILLGIPIKLPPIKASLTLEDGECSTTGDCEDSN
jgi:Flp pilus assembly protein TadG